MDNQLMELNDKDISITTPEINFKSYEKLKSQALQVSDFVENIVVTEESVKEAKKVLATSRKIVKKLDRGRIDTKNRILDPYEVFKAQVDKITGIINKANDELNSKVKELDEKERQEKRATLEKLWHEKTQVYPYSDYITFEDFIEPQHLNKSYSVAKIEEEMSEFLDRVQKDLGLLKSKEDSERYIKRYLEDFNLTDTLLFNNPKSF